MKRLVLFVIVLGVAACEGGRSPDPMPIELEDRGTACMHGDTVLAFSANQPIEVRVTWDDVCLSSSCTEDRMSSCTVTVVDRVATITTHASWFDTSATSNGCTDDCGMLSATCETPALAANDYMFVLAGRSTAITVPSQVSMQPCI